MIFSEYDFSKIPPETKFECKICWWEYDPAQGEETQQIMPGTAFIDLPDSWSCPNCAAGRDKFIVGVED